MAPSAAPTSPQRAFLDTNGKEMGGCRVNLCEGCKTRSGFDSVERERTACWIGSSCVIACIHYQALRSHPRPLSLAWIIMRRSPSIWQRSNRG